MRFIAVCILILSCILSAASTASGQQPTAVFLSVEEKGVLLIDPNQARQDPSAILWSWQAADSPQIPTGHRRWFNGYDECKPVLDGSALLVCSSWEGAVAMVSRSDKACLFYAKAKNAHSAELIGKNLLAAAISSEDGELRLYRLNDPATPMLNAQPIWSMKLAWGHGVVYDAARDRLYALGGRELLVLQIIDGPELKVPVLSRHELPKSSGHDLFPYDKLHLSVTVGQAAYLFDRDKLAFSPLPNLADKADLKSVSRHPDTGKVMFTQAEPGQSHTSKLQWTDGTELVLPYEMIYKARWDAAATE